MRESMAASFPGWALRQGEVVTLRFILPLLRLIEKTSPTQSELARRIIEMIEANG